MDTVCQLVTSECTVDPGSCDRCVLGNESRCLCPNDVGKVSNRDSEIARDKEDSVLALATIFASLKAARMRKRVVFVLLMQCSIFRSWPIPLYL